MFALKQLVVGEDEIKKFKTALVARFMSSDEEMEDANTRRKRLVTRSTFETSRNSLNFRLLPFHLKDPSINSLTENVDHCLREMFHRTWQKIVGYFLVNSSNISTLPWLIVRMGQKGRFLRELIEKTILQRA